MKNKSNVRAGVLTCRKAGGDNHNQMVAREAKKGLRVKTNVKAGIIAVLRNDKNHSQATTRETKKGLRVRTDVKAGMVIIFI
jgi:hypothetical protein